MNHKESMVSPDYVKKSGGICERLWTAATELLNSSLSLEEALLKRRVDDVWLILAEQEKKSSTLNQAAKLWSQVYGDNWENLSADLQQARQEIRTKLQKLQIAEKVNYSLTRNYLSAVERSMLKAGAGLAGKKKVYNKGGRLGLKSSSMLFKSIG